MKRSIHCLLLLTCVLGAAPGAAASRWDTGLEPDPMPPTTKGAGLRALLDPASGRLIDTPVTPEQRAFLQALPRPDYSKMQLEYLADGSVVLHTNGQHMMSAIVRQRDDGSTEEYCVPSAAGEQP